MIKLNNYLFIHNQLCDDLPTYFSNYFKLVEDQYRHDTRGSNQFTLNVPRVNTEIYWSNTVKIKATKDLNKTAKKNQFRADLLFKQREFVRLVKAFF